LLAYLTAEAFAIPPKEILHEEPIYILIHLTGHW